MKIRCRAVTRQSRISVRLDPVSVDENADHADFPMHL